MGRSDVDDETFFKDLARPAPNEPRAPARLKSRVYSALMRRAAASGRLRSLTATKEAGSTLCVFEAFCQMLPLGTRFDSLNFCRACHGRIVGENMNDAPIFWKGCPYADYHQR